MSELKIEGKLIKDFGTVQISDKFKKREFVIETDGKYPQQVAFQLTQDKTDLLDVYKLGETLIVNFNIRGREWNERFFVNLDAWRLEKVGVSNSEAVRKVQNAAIKNQQPETIPEGEDDLPF